MKRAFALVFVLVCACGSRTELDNTGPSAPDASPPPPAVCRGTLEYTSHIDDIEPHGMSFALNSTYVFFTEDGDVVRIPKEGGAPETLTVDAGVYSLGADDSFVYWVNPHSGWLEKMPAGGGDAQDVVCAVAAGCSPGPLGSPMVMAVTSDDVVIANAGLLLVASKQGDSIYPLYGGQAGSVSTKSLVADDQRVAWNGYDFVYWVPLDAGAPPKALGTWPGAVSLAAGTLYWTERDDETWHLAREGANGAIDLGVVHFSTAMSASPSFVYGGVDGGLVKTSTSGGSEVPVIEDGTPIAIVVDGPCVYYTVRVGNQTHLRRTPG